MKTEELMINDNLGIFKYTPLKAAINWKSIFKMAKAYIVLVLRGCFTSS